MSGDRRKEIVRHLSEENLDRLLAETDDEKVSKRLTFVKRLYKGATLEDAADDVGKSASTGSRWARRWNEGGLGLLTPNFGAGRPPKLGEHDDESCSNSSETGSLGKQEIQHLINQEFGVEYHPVYLGQFLKTLGLSTLSREQSVPLALRTPKGFDERVGDAFNETEADKAAQQT